MPSGVGGFTTVIYGGLMEETDESYSITFTLIEDDNIVTVQTIENPIHEYTEHSVHITVSEGHVEIGEKGVTELEVEHEPEPEQEPESKGIPGFPYTSVMIGMIVAIFTVLCMKRARCARARSGQSEESGCTGQV